MLITKQRVVADVDVTVDLIGNVGGVGVVEDVGVGLVAPDQSAILYSLWPGGVQC